MRSSVDAFDELVIDLVNDRSTKLEGGTKLSSGNTGFVVRVADTVGWCVYLKSLGRMTNFFTFWARDTAFLLPVAIP